MSHVTAPKHLLAAIAAISVSNMAGGITVVSQVIEDAWLYNSDDRYEHILNNTGSNAGRWSAARFDTTILAAQAFTDSAQYTLTSATLTLTERADRDGNNGTQSGRVGAYFYNTAEVSGWNLANLATYSWHGNSSGRPGRVGGDNTAPGLNNVDERSNGTTDLIYGLNSPASAGDGASWVNHTFTTANSAETAVIDLTQGGATLLDIQSLLADWVAGDNAGLILAGEFGNQSFWQSNGVTAGNSVGSTIDGDSTNSGLSLEAAGSGESVGGLFLTLEFTPIPEPSVVLLGGLGLLGLLRRRR